jgi:hypothetical protein
MRFFVNACIVLGAVLFIAGGAQAFAIEPSAGGGVSWESLGTLALGLVVTVLGAYLKGIQSTVARTVERVDALAERLSGEHYDKDEAADVIAAAIAPIERDLKHILQTLDRIASSRGVSRPPPHMLQDDGA